jgi:hypothetical protein
MYDLHVLDGCLTAVEQQQFRAIVAARGLSSIASEGLAAAERSFGDSEAAEPTPGRSATHDDSSGPWTQAELLRLDLQALPDWRTRGRLLREHLIPPSSYMRAKYGVQSNVMLPALYLWRALQGMPKWLRRPAVDD